MTVSDTNSNRWVVLNCHGSLVFGPDSFRAACDRAKQLSERDKAEWRADYGSWREPPKPNYHVGELPETIGDTRARLDRQVEQLLVQLRAKRAGRLFLRVGRWLRLWRFA